MTDPLQAEAASELLYAAAARGTLAPSIHNTQPWRFVIRGNSADLYADRERQAPVVDPHGRQLAISCGAALFGARAALAAAQVDATVTLLPDGAQPDLLARLTIHGRLELEDEVAARLDAAADHRHSNRRQFSPDPVPDHVVEVLRAAADSEGAWLHFVTHLEDRIALARLSQRADAMQNAEPAYRAELREWTADRPDRDDGVPAAAIPHVTGGAHDDIPIRDFDTEGSGELPEETASRLTQTLAVLGTDGDTVQDWLMAGQALHRALLELTRAGYAASVFSQACEIPSLRQQLRDELRLFGYPHLFLRVGKADPTPATPRRAFDAVISSE